MYIKEIVSAQKEKLKTMLNPQERALGEIISITGGARYWLNRFRVSN